MQTYTCTEINALTRDVTAARRTSIAEAGQEIAELLKASHATVEVRLKVLSRANGNTDAAAAKQCSKARAVGAHGSSLIR